MKITLNAILNMLLVIAAAFLIGRYFYMQPDYDDGEKAPDFSAQDINGDPFTLSDLQGDYVLLDFWGSWCGPCRRQNPKLVALYDKFEGQTFADGAGFKIVSVAIERNAEAWRRAIESDGLRWPHHLLDQTTSMKFFDGTISDQYGVKQIPTSFLIDPEGMIIGVNLSARAIERLLTKRHS